MLKDVVGASLVVVLVELLVVVARVDVLLIVVVTVDVVGVVVVAVVVEVAELSVALMLVEVAVLEVEVEAVEMAMVAVEEVMVVAEFKVPAAVVNREVLAAVAGTRVVLADAAVAVSGVVPAAAVVAVSRLFFGRSQIRFARKSKQDQSLGKQTKLGSNILSQILYLYCSAIISRTCARLKLILKIFLSRDVKLLTRYLFIMRRKDWSAIL